MRWQDSRFRRTRCGGGVGICVARPGGPQQLLVLQPHAVVQPYSVRLRHKDAFGYLSAGPNEAAGATLSCSAGCFAEFGYPIGY